MKDIVIVANFSQIHGENGNNRFSYIADLLSCVSDVELITSTFCHRTKKQRVECSDITKSKYIITTIYEPGYSKNISLRRFYSHFVWGKNVKQYLKNRKYPEVIYCAVPSLTAAFLVARFCEKNKIKFIVDVQDLWPEAFKMVFNIPIISDIIFAPFQYVANEIYKKADVIYGVSDTYVNRALQVNKKDVNGHTVFLGTDLNTYDVNVKNNPVQKPKFELWMGYCGTLGDSYDLKCVFDALEIIRNRKITPPKFIVMGDGPKQRTYKQYAKHKDLDVLFTDRLPYAKMCGMLSMCDIAVNPIRKGSAGSIINKHADYAAAGIPVINNQESEEYRALVEQYGMGLNCKCGDPLDMAEKLIVIIESEEIRLKMGKQARRCAEERFNRSVTYEKIIELI